MKERFSLTFTAAPHHIDELGHVNNAVWLQWIQEIAVAHWQAVADAASVARSVWVVTRHEIDYRGNIRAGETATATTFIPNPPKGAQFDRRVDFHSADGKLLVSALSRWAMIDRATGRLMRVPADLAARFMAD